MITVLVFVGVLSVFYLLFKMLTVDERERGRLEEIARSADAAAKLKEKQTNVVMAPKTVDDTATDLDNGTF
jgi:hypothetical protein